MSANMSDPADDNDEKVPVTNVNVRLPEHLSDEVAMAKQEGIHLGYLNTYRQTLEEYKQEVQSKLSMFEDRISENPGSIGNRLKNLESDKQALMESFHRTESLVIGVYGNGGFQSEMANWRLLMADFQGRVTSFENQANGFRNEIASLRNDVRNSSKCSCGGMCFSQLLSVIASLLSSAAAVIAVYYTYQTRHSDLPKNI